MPEADWTVIVPIKSLASAKQRLRGAVPDHRHEELVLAMAQDTVAAALASPGVATVLVVSSDPVIGATMSDLCAKWIREPGGDGLNAAVAHSAVVAGGPPVAVIPADLPALRPVDLAEALRAAGTAGLAAGTAARTGAAGGTAGLAAGTAARARAAGGAGATAGRSFVPDAGGHGTVLLAATGDEPLAPRFGPDSARAHEQAGATRLHGEWPTLRRDVDTAADLAAASVLGLGRHTTALMRVAFM
jgi:2-phospho-L-lactate/phosphoenolpyruvate guanylyltransferase